MCHDYKHSGFSNNFEISFKTPIALTYNGNLIKDLNSLLENIIILNSIWTFDNEILKIYIIKK